MVNYLSRTLTYINEKGETMSLNDDEILALGRSVVILGEPGMGKSWLLEQLAATSEWRLISAARFVAHPAPEKLVPAHGSLIIDGLDQLMASQESDAVNRVLAQLIRAGCPSFVLSCRSMDWRGASARQDIADEYLSAPIELTISPFSREQALAFLSSEMSAQESERILTHLDSAGIPELYGNPLTLGLIQELAEDGNPLPDTRAELLRLASERMWNERNDHHKGSPLAGLDKWSALDGAGALCAAFVLSGAEAITTVPSARGQALTLHVADVTVLPKAEGAEAVIGSRLFTAVPGQSGLFRPMHRAMAEYLGARWLIRITGDDLTRRRIMAMMKVGDRVPASLRGIFAWLSQSSEFAPDIINADPYAVLRYGDADGLKPEHGRQLLASLKGLHEIDPYFRAEDWTEHSAKGLGHSELEDDIRPVLLSEETGFHLRTVILNAIRNTPVAAKLIDALQELVLQQGGRSYAYGERKDAAEVLAAVSDQGVNWADLVDQLNVEGTEDSTRLVLEILDDINFIRVSPQQIAYTSINYLGLAAGPNRVNGRRHTIGVLYLLGRRLPQEMIGDVLDHTADLLAGDDVEQNYQRDTELSDYILRLVARHLDVQTPAPARLLAWLRMSRGRHGYSSDVRERIDAFFRTDTVTRRAIQEQVLFLESEPEDAWGRIWRLGNLDSGLAFTLEDVLHFLSILAVRLEAIEVRASVWRGLVTLSRRWVDNAEDIFSTASVFACGQPDLVDELNALLIPMPTPEWEIEDARRRNEEFERRSTAWSRHRQEFTNEQPALRTGNLNQIYVVSEAYLGLFYDLNNDLSAPERLVEWLGESLQNIALEGFEAVLHRLDLPTPEAVAETYATGQRLYIIRPMIVGIAERIRCGLSLGDITANVLIGVRLALHYEPLIDRLPGESIETAIDAELHKDTALFETYVRLMVEPGLRRGATHIQGLYGLVRSADDRALTGRLAAEWLQTYPEVSGEVESELVDALMSSGVNAAIFELFQRKSEEGFTNDAQRRLWWSVGLLTNFNISAPIIGNVAEADKDLLWFLRSRLRVVGRSSMFGEVNGNASLWGWIVSQFRTLWPYASNPFDESSGDTNEWDATEFLLAVINRLASDPSPAATEELERLLEGADDGYRSHLLHAARQQDGVRSEIEFPGVSLDHLRTIVDSSVPDSATDLTEILSFALDKLQAQVRGSDTDIVQKYWADDGTPYSEDVCTDRLIEDLERLIPVDGVARIPQADMPKGKRADIAYTVESVIVPVEAKGQWHKDLWSAASGQLDDLYLRDWRAQDRGIYIVYWFGDRVPSNKKLKEHPSGGTLPASPAEFKTQLIESIPADRRASLIVYVLDFTK